MAPRGFSFWIEALKLYQAPWLASVRHTTLGHLVLGHAFSWQNPVAYTVGVLVGLVREVLVVPSFRASGGRNAVKQNHRIPGRTALSDPLRGLRLLVRRVWVPPFGSTVSHGTLECLNCYGISLPVAARGNPSALILFTVFRILTLT